jgi:hypothetical protein
MRRISSGRRTQTGWCPLDEGSPPLYDFPTSLLFGADLGFHEEWLRDEPREATTTGSGGNSWSPGVNSRPEQGEHEIRGAAFLASRTSFPFPEKRFWFSEQFYFARPRLLEASSSCRNTDTNCAAGNAARAGETSRVPSATIASLRWKFSTTTTRFVAHSRVSRLPHGRPTCGVTRNCCPCPKNILPPCP